MSELVRQARRELLVFLVLTFAVSWAIAAHLIGLGGDTSGHGLTILALMWTPGLVSVVCRLVFKTGFKDVSFGLGRDSRSWLVAWLAPLVVGLSAYGFAWVNGIHAFEPPAANGLERALHLDGLPSGVRFVAWMLVMLVVGTGMGAISAAGEELGWRGYMTTRLVDSGVPRPLLVGGVVWGVWHLPLILSGQYAAGTHRWLSAALFMLTIVGAAHVAGMVRLRSASLWPAVIFHASWNAQIQGVFDRFSALKAHPDAALWLGESGLLVCAASLLVAYAVLRLHRRSPLHLELTSLATPHTQGVCWCPVLPGPIGNPVRIRSCPAAVSENESRDAH